MLALATVVIASASATSAHAQQVCAKRSEAVAVFEKKGMTLRGTGIIEDFAVFEFWTAGDGKPYAAIVSYPNGLSCFSALGEEWMERGK
jgi:hypothetical protein